MTVPRSARRCWTAAVLVVPLCLVGTGWPALARAADRASMVIHAVVLAVDPARGLVMLHHEALETEAPTDRICRLSNRRELRLLSRGTVIEATVETSHDPWIIEHVRVRAHIHVFVGAADAVAI